MITPAVMIIGIVLCTAARVFTISQTDMRFGSIVHGYEVVCNALYYGMILLSAVLAAVFAVPPARVSAESETDARPDGFGGGTAAVGFGLLAVGAGAGCDALSMMGVFSPIYVAVCIAFAAAFVITAFITLTKKEIPRGLGFAYSFGGIYFVLRGIFCFMNRMVVANVPEYLISVLSAVLGGLFFAMAGKLFSGNEGRMTRRMLCAWGVGTSVMTISATLGAAAAKLFLGDEISQCIVLTSADAAEYHELVRGVDGYRLACPAFSDIGLGVLALIVVIAVCLRGSEAAVSADIPEDND